MGSSRTVTRLSGRLFVSIFLVLLCAAASTPASQSGDKKPKSDWDAYFGAGIAPPYPFSGTLKVISSGDYEFSNTDANGQTTSSHCSSDEYRTDCYDGPGIYFYLVPVDAQPANGQDIFVSSMPWISTNPF